MTSTTPNLSPIESTEAMARRIEAAAQKQVAEDIARLKAMGCRGDLSPITLIG